MGCLCLYRSTLLTGGLLFLLMLADPAFPAGSRPPVVLGEARVQLWVRWFVRPAGWGAGGAVCISSKHEVGLGQIQRTADCRPVLGGRSQLRLGKRDLGC